MSTDYQEREGTSTQFGGAETPAEAAYTVAPDIPAHYLDDSLPESEAASAPENIEEGADAQEDRPRKQPKQRDSIRERLSQAQREKFQYINALNELQRENEELKNAAELSAESAMIHYEEGVSERLEKARQAKIQAYESGDIQAQVDADLQFNLATNDAVALNNWKAQQALTQQQTEYSSQNEEAHYNAMRESEAINWAQQNAGWFHPSSPHYDEWMANQVHAYCNEFDNNLFRNGLDYLMYTPEYFDTINQHVHALASNRHSNRSELRMRPARGAVSPVRSGHSGQSEYTGQPTHAKLSAEEKEVVKMLKSLGGSEKGYLRARLKEEREAPHKRGRTRGYGQ